MKQFTVLLDLDGVLADLYRHLVNKKLMVPMYDDPTNIGKHIPFPCDWNSTDYYFWSTIPRTKHCDSIIEFLLSEFDPDNIFVCTSPVRVHGCIDGKIDWIRHNIPIVNMVLRRQFIIGPHKYLLSHIPNSLLIDDDTEHCKAFNQHGKSILMPANWNIYAGRDPLQHLQNEVEKLKRQQILNTPFSKDNSRDIDFGIEPGH